MGNVARPHNKIIVANNLSVEKEITQRIEVMSKNVRRMRNVPTVLSVDFEER